MQDQNKKNESVELEKELGELNPRPGPGEIRKRKREVLFIFLISVLFLGLTWFEIRLFGISQELPFVHSIFFFGLVNFNIILLLLLLFLIFRNLVKVFVERRGKVIGSSLKAKLIAAFVAFSSIPTLLMFVISVFYINSSFDKWFSVKMSGVLKSSLEVTNAYYFNAKKKNYHFAHLIADRVHPILLHSSRPNRQIEQLMLEFQKTMSLDAIEFYPSLLGDRILVLAREESIPEVPNLSLEFLTKGIHSHTEASTIHQFGEGNLVRVIVPIDENKEMGAIVVSSYVPLSLISKMNDIASAYEDFKNVDPLEYPLKSIYTIILFMITLVILFGAIWFGFHLAKQLSVPLVLLGRATRRIAGGDYSKVDMESGSEEINQLIESFNQMTFNLEQSESNLKVTLSNLDQYSKYIAVVLDNVSTGVVSLNREGHILTMNHRACELLKVKEKDFIGKTALELFSGSGREGILGLQKQCSERKLDLVQAEVTAEVDGGVLPLQMTLSLLRDERENEMGRILVFDDLSVILNAQRAAAWTEVARRIAHEIKNPLTPIKLSAERLQRKFSKQISDPAFSECTSMIIKQTDELKFLVNEFSQFARLPQVKMVLSQLNQVIEESLVLYRAALPQHQIEFVKDPGLPEFKFDPDQIRRVLTNLIDNAIAAIPPNQVGQISLTTHFDQELRMVKIIVADNGSGIAPDDRKRIFEPYFSTKLNGTGLGLPIVKRIIEDHNGFIRAFANEPCGTKMQIELPVA